MTTRPQSHEDWLPVLHRRRSASVRLFCFPYAGAGPQVYRPWADQLPESIEVCPVQLPGRGSRLKEPPLDRLEPLLESLVAAMTPRLDMPFAFQGHSLGALIAYETAQLLKERAIAPAQLFVSGMTSPHLPNPNPPLHDLPDAEFADELNRLGGIPKMVFECPELMALMLPALRCDFTLLETYTHRHADPLGCPIHVFGGGDDPRTDLAGLEAWREMTTGPFGLTMMPGDHFFIDPCRPAILRAIAARLHANGVSCTTPAIG